MAKLPKLPVTKITKASQKTKKVSTGKFPSGNLKNSSPSFSGGSSVKPRTVSQRISKANQIYQAKQSKGF